MLLCLCYRQLFGWPSLKAVCFCLSLLRSSLEDGWERRFQVSQVSCNGWRRSGLRVVGGLELFTLVFLLHLTGEGLLRVLDVDGEAAEGGSDTGSVILRWLKGFVVLHQG